MPLQLTNRFTYGYSVSDMLNNTEGLKRENFCFGLHDPSVKLLVNLLMTDLPADQKLPTNIFSMDGFRP
jgi:hypothetical protein